MKTIPSLVVFDGALSNPVKAREDVLSHPFREETGPDGAKYKNICQEAQPTEEFSAFIEAQFGVKPDIQLSFWRIDLDGDLPHSVCHADSICADYAAVLYATPNAIAKGGTAFWKHTGTGWNHLPSDAELELAGIEPASFHPWMTNETKKPAAWEIVGFAGMKFNRLLLYPTKMWHSRHPDNGFGQNQENGRLIWVAFFDLLDPKFIAPS